MTINVPDQLEHDIRYAAKENNQSISFFISDIVRSYLIEKKRKKLGTELLNTARNLSITEDAVEILHRMRKENDRS
jgi:hypothetical protein